MHISFSPQRRDEMAVREVSGGEPIPPALKIAAANIRARSDEIEVMDPIPADFRGDGYWT